MIPFWSIDVMGKSRNSVELIQDGNGLIPCCFSLIMKARLSAKLKVLIMNIRFHSYDPHMQTVFNMERFALSLAFIMRFTATQK